MLRISTCIVLFTGAMTVLAQQQRPQDNRGRGDQYYSPMPYDFNWEVHDEQYKNFYGQNEVGNGNGRVDGSYHVWLPDGRLMTVTYYVDGESGFVPKITYQQTSNPFSGKRR